MSNNQHQYSDLLKRLKNDDATAMKVIFQQHYPMVYKTLYRILSDVMLAEDLAQDVFMRFWEKRQQIDIQGTLEGYIRRMAVNEGLGYLRKNKKYTIENIEDDTAETAPSIEDSYLDNELQHQIDHAVNSLPPQCRAVFVLSRFEELSHKEISEKLNISTKTIENQITKALKNLKTALKSYLASVLF